MGPHFFFLVESCSLYLYEILANRMLCYSKFEHVSEFAVDLSLTKISGGWRKET